MFNIPIYYFWLVAIITATIGVLALLTWTLLKSVYTRSMKMDMKKNKSVVIKSKKKGEDAPQEETLTEKSKKTKTLQLCLRILSPIMVISYTVALACIITYCGFYTMAKKYGAYDDFTKVETIKTISNMPNTSFVDQSNQLPTGDARLGCIIVFYKYNCPDCIAVHDMVLETLHRFPNAEVYFVSTRSEIGKQLVAEFGIEEVPSAVYIRKPDLEHTVESFGPFTFWYRDFFQRKPNGDAIVDENGNNTYQSDDFELLLTLQQETNDQIYWQQYYIDHPDEQPTYAPGWGDWDYENYPTAPSDVSNETTPTETGGQ